MDRREFLRIIPLAIGAVGMARPPWKQGQGPRRNVLIDDFDRPDSYYHGDGWQSLNPGYWKVEDGALRRRLSHCGDDRPTNWFPWHWESHPLVRGQSDMPTDTDPSLPFGMIFRRDWKLSGDYAIQVDATVRGLTPTGGDLPDWKQHQPGYGLMGIAFGSQCQHESWAGGGEPGDAAWMACWRDDERFGVYDHATDAPAPVHEEGAEAAAPALAPGDEITIEVRVSGAAGGNDSATVIATFTGPDGTTEVTLTGVDAKRFTDGYFGLVARGLLDFEVGAVRLVPQDNQPLDAPVSDLHVAYPLGDTLRKEDAKEGAQWRCRFVALFRSAGEEAAIRIARASEPQGGWRQVPVAGRAEIVTNDFRRNTALLDATLPASPADTEFYYTVWKDGKNVTADLRPGTDSVGPGTGFTGALPEGYADGRYVGRLPQLKAPYRLSGLSCHAVEGNNPDLPQAGKFQPWWIHDQPTHRAYQHLEDFDFQVMLWEDDIWYLERIMPPPSTDGAYKIITTAIAGPTSRWQMMRHWNVLNPGDHDYGMDDVKGPEQLILRNEEGLGQDPEYMRRNFQIVEHLTRGLEAPPARENPKRWRRWAMPDRDFSLVILDSRLWRTSQDTNIWDDEGWGHKESLYSRTNPTRTLLGEEQFAWLQNVIRTDPAPLVGLTGINSLHSVWAGANYGKKDVAAGAHPGFKERDRVAADYASWVKAGADRVLELLGSRQGVVSVYGDVHAGCIMEDLQQGLFESCFGPIGRYGGRTLKQDFGPRMEDYDGREVKVHALYHDEYGTPDLEPVQEPPRYWNFLEMRFDPRGEDPQFELAVRNMIDAPSQAPRGGGHVAPRASETGRSPTSRLPTVETLPNAEVLLTRTDGTPVRGTRSLPDGTLPLDTLIDVPPNTSIIATARTSEQVQAQSVRTHSL